MDISVSRLNNRLALQLPSELPLGLVFVSGRVQNLSQSQSSLSGKAASVTFDLLEKEHILRCRLSQRTAAEVTLEEGFLIRAGGHLSFDATYAGYFLLARDVEIVAEETSVVAPGKEVSAASVAVDEPSLPEPAAQSRLEKTGLAKALTDVKKRSQAVKQVSSDMPVWVQRMAPPGVAVEAEKSEAGEVKTAVSPPSPNPEQSALDQRLVDFVDKALEGDEELELTPELLNQFELKEDKPRSRRATTRRLPAVAAEAKPAPAPSAQSPDRLTAVLLLTLIMLIIVIAIMLVLSWL